ncbi:PP2C family protein-serine/threonine phosphatase [Acidicapsa acidisoli]|uniref:PP2C family protein-serine/threonine phosphatase n=1 Tax=Acidicapsa acidisoli TaxID=1615681 RepID=UPI0021DF9799|nr:SpoIIE family protein phosphatase [Acidicapsa acidisoli]
MRKLLILLAPFVLSISTSAAAQTYNLDANHPPLVSLDGLWRFHAGDNPAWTDPNFDDSDWSLLKSTEGWSSQGYRGMSGMAWYRFRINIPAKMERVSLLLPRIFTSYEVYANGQLIGAQGKMPPNEEPNTGGNIRIFTVPPGQKFRGLVEISIRVWYSPIEELTQDGGIDQGGGSLLGDSRWVRFIGIGILSRWHWYLAGEQTVGFVELLAGFGVLALYALRRKETEYLWYGLALIFQAASKCAQMTAFFIPWPSIIYDIVANGLSAATILASIAFYRALLRLHHSPLLTLLVGLIVVSLPFGPIAYLTPRILSPSLAALISSLLMLPAFVWIVYVLVKAAVRNSLDARLLLVPVLLSISTTIFFQAANITALIGWQSVITWPAITLSNQPMHIELGHVIDLLSLLSIFAVLILRFTRTRSEEERYATEVEGARSVQQFLIPEDLPEIPGLTIESDYRPAREVGGDFFQVIPDTSDGSTLILIGDVAGKGMQAGMLATLLVGAMRTAATFTRDPITILSTLNNRLNGKGNATCLALRVGSDGAATLVNAGHLPPYLNGIELPMEGALPLGTIPNIDFPVLKFKIAPGDTLTLISDGILEAQKPNGELFGFDRIIEHLRQSTNAAGLATAAQNFGQEDDITVLTVTRLNEVA